MHDVFEALRAILEPHTKSLNVTQNDAENFWVDTFFVMKNGKPLFFGAVQIKKNYVSYHLMPVYVKPALLDNVSPELLKRMQGKSCFNFKTIDRALFRELRQLTKLGLKDYRDSGYLKRSKGEGVH